MERSRETLGVIDAEVFGATRNDPCVSLRQRGCSGKGMHGGRTEKMYKRKKKVPSEKQEQHVGQQKGEEMSEFRAMGLIAQQTIGTLPVEAIGKMQGDTSEKAVLKGFDDKKVHDGTSKKVSRRKSKVSVQQEEQEWEHNVSEANVDGPMGICVQPHREADKDGFIPSEWHADAGGMRSRYQGMAALDGFQDERGAQERSETLNAPDHSNLFAEAAESSWYSNILVVRDWQLYCPYAPFSAKLQHTIEDQGPDLGKIASPFLLPLFGSSKISNMSTCKEAGLANDCDFLLNVGGSVWAMDWCPQRPLWPVKYGTRSEFLAVGTHPQSEPVHRLGEPVCGRGLIQIWAFSFPSCLEAQEISHSWKDFSNGEKRGGTVPTVDNQCSSKVPDENTLEAGTGFAQASFLENNSCIRSGKKVNKKKQARDVKSGKFPVSLPNVPQMAMGLAHDGGLAWDVKWQPSTSPDFTDKKEKLRLGYLAVLFGDGSVQVFDLPLPSMLNHFEGQNRCSFNGDPFVIKSAPVFRCSGLSCGEQKSIPLNLEWSTCAPHDLLLVGCHNGLVALWRFDPWASPDQDARPLLSFIADSAPIRAITWAPNDSGNESRNLVATAGHSGALRFWDIRDPFRPLWDLLISRGCILSIDWLPDPRCILLSMDDGTLRILSLNVAANDTPVTGKVCTKTQFQGLHSYMCTSFAIWSVQVSRATGLVAYGGEDGSVNQFQLTQKAVEKEGLRYREPHYLCGAFDEHLETGIISITSQKLITPVQMKKSLTEWSQTPVSKRGFTVGSNTRQCGFTEEGKSPSSKAKQRKHSSRSLLVSVNMGFNFPCSVEENKKNPEEISFIDASQLADVNGNSMALVPCNEEICQKGKNKNNGTNFERNASPAIKISQLNAGHVDSLSLVPFDGDMEICEEFEPIEKGKGKVNNIQSSRARIVEKLPPKSVAVQMVRWNCNKGSERWLCYGGAAGIIRCQWILPHS